MANHAKANKHLAAAAKHSKAGNARLAQHHAFLAARALSSGQQDGSPSGDSTDEPDADDMGGPSDNDQDNQDNQGADHGGGMDGNGNGHFIQSAIKHPGALHRELGVPQGQTIPAKKVEQAAHSSNPTLAKRARLAETLKRLRGK